MCIACLTLTGSGWSAGVPNAGMLSMANAENAEQA